MFVVPININSILNIISDDEKGENTNFKSYTGQSSWVFLLK